MQTPPEFVAESNRIEGIYRDPTAAEMAEFHRFMALEKITVDDLEKFVSVYQPDARLRVQMHVNVRVGDYFPPAGGPHIFGMLEDILNDASLDAFTRHLAYERLHPFLPTAMGAPDGCCGYGI